MRASDLSGQPGTTLICSDAYEAHGEFSADPRDYWADDRPIPCGECGAPLIEVRFVRNWVPVIPTEPDEHREAGA